MYGRHERDDVKARVPGDEIVWARDGWEISVSRSTRTVRFATTDYHAQPLTLTKQELHRLAKITNNRVSGFRPRRRP